MFCKGFRVFVSMIGDSNLGRIKNTLKVIDYQHQTHGHRQRRLVSDTSSFETIPFIKKSNYIV